MASRGNNHRETDGMLLLTFGKRHNHSMRLLILLLFYVAAPLAAGLSCYWIVRYYALEPRDPLASTPVLFDTETASSFRAIAHNLEQQGFIRSSLAFRALGRLEKKDTQIKAGEYELSASMTPQAILDKMVRGEMLQRRATIKEGMTIREIATALEDAGIVDAPSIVKAAHDPALLQERGVSATSFEGYLFPETYSFRRNTPAKKIIAVMHEELQKRWLSDWAQRTQILGMSAHQILTLASIIEKESGNFEEQPVISSVFHNRLKYNMRLQADPTVIYGIKDFDGNITKRDLLTETPYNTYTITGLPPGPIANPGLNAIKAALYPADTNFLYFVGNGAGKHIFSETLNQHNDAVNRYQRGRGLVGSATEPTIADPASETDRNEHSDQATPAPGLAPTSLLGAPLPQP